MKTIADEATARVSSAEVGGRANDVKYWIEGAKYALAIVKEIEDGRSAANSEDLRLRGSNQQPGYDGSPARSGFDSGECYE